MNAHFFRKDRQTHVVLSMRNRVRRNGVTLTLCAQRVDDSFQRRPDGPMSCDRCSRAFDGFVDVMDTVFGYGVDHDDGTGRWS